MHLNNLPFKKIKSGKKTVEGRLLDEKRQLLKVGDEIEFVLRGSEEKLQVVVDNIENQKTFAEMYGNTNLKDWDWYGTKDEFVSEFYKYYSKKEELKYGTLAIHFKLI